MEFIPYRLLQTEPAKVRQLLEHQCDLIVTSNDEPFAVMIGIKPDKVEDTLTLLAQTRARLAVSSMRAVAQKRGLNRLSPEEIDAEIKAARAERGQP